MLPAPNRNSARRSHSADQVHHWQALPSGSLFRKYHHEGHEDHKDLEKNEKIDHENTKLKSTKSYFLFSFPLSCFRSK